MKCQKCGYISFDGNQFCPKCNKDISDEITRLNLPLYKINPPSLLGRLTGESKESDLSYQMDTSGTTGTAAHSDVVASAQDMGTSEATEPSFDDTQKFEIQFESVPEEAQESSLESVDSSDLTSETVEVDLSREESVEDLSAALDDLTFEEPEATLADSDESTVDEIDLDAELSGSEVPDIEDIAVMESPPLEEEPVSLDLEELSVDESDIVIEEAPLEETPVEEAIEEAPLEMEGPDSDLKAPEEVLDTAGLTEEKEAKEIDEDFSLDLESLDLDLELEESEEK
jgi:hypothetical protein